MIPMLAIDVQKKTLHADLKNVNIKFKAFCDAVIKELRKYFEIEK